MSKNELVHEWCAGVEYVARIESFLREIEDIMIPALTNRVDIDAYSQKLAANADTIFIVKDSVDIASCSIYCNSEDAFISSIAVKQEFFHNNIGTIMMKTVIEHSREKKCKRILLRVYSDNIRAIRFYKKNGFYITEALDNWKVMVLNL